MFPLIRIRFRYRFRKTVSALPFRSAVAVMPLRFGLSVENGRVELSIGPAGPAGWPASFPRFPVPASNGNGENSTRSYLNG